VFKSVIKNKFISLNPFALLIINVKIFSNFQKEWCTFGRKKGTFEKRLVHSLSLNAFNMQKHFWFLSSFEHVDFAINEKYSKFFYDNLNYYVSFVIFQTYKNALKECPLIWVAPLTMFLLQVEQKMITLVKMINDF
jgi:hypothetical protein